MLGTATMVPSAATADIRGQKIWLRQCAMSLKATVVFTFGRRILANFAVLLRYGNMIGAISSEVINYRLRRTGGVAGARHRIARALGSTCDSMTAAHLCRFDHNVGRTRRLTMGTTRGVHGIPDSAGTGAYGQRRRE